MSSEKLQSVILGTSMLNAGIFGMLALEANNSAVEDRTLATVYAAEGTLSSAERHNRSAEDDEMLRNIWGTVSALSLVSASLNTISIARRNRNQVNQ